MVRLIGQNSLSSIVRRNAAFAVAKLGSANPGDRAVLLKTLADPDPSVRAACRWALVQMALPTSDTK
jgi:HEAT repeat protein